MKDNLWNKRYIKKLEKYVTTVPKKKSSESESQFFQRCITHLQKYNSEGDSISICAKENNLNIKDFLKIKKIEETKQTCGHNPKIEEHLSKCKGEDLNELLNNGFKITSTKLVDNFTKEDFRVVSFPSLVSYLDTMTYKVRFRYTGPQDDKTRDFCRMMLNRNLVYRIEDILDINSVDENPDFDKYDVLTYKGSYGCRHNWEEIILQKEIPQPKRSGSIILLD